MANFTFTDDGATILMVASGKSYNLKKDKIKDIQVQGNLFQFKEGDQQFEINFDIHTTNPAAATAEIFRPLFEAFLDPAASSAVTIASFPSGTETPTASLETTSGMVAAGCKSVTFVTSSNFAGTILGVARNPSTSYIFTAETPGATLAAIAYTVTAGSMTIDITV